VDVVAFAASPPNPAVNARTPFQIFANLVEPPLICIALLGVLVRSATCISQERERGTWESLLVTPLGPAEISAAKLLGSLLCMRSIWLLVALLWLLGMAAGQLRPVFVGGAALLVTVLAFCTAAVGMSLSLSMRSSLRALSVGVALTLVLSGGYLLCAFPLVVPTLASQQPPFLLLSPCIPFLLVSSMLLAIQDQTNSSLVVAACALGGALYAITGLLLLAAVRRWFNQLAGRAGISICRLAVTCAASRPTRHAPTHQGP
jgi:ABC-type Na+ efflux pump permease subunit